MRYRLLAAVFTAFALTACYDDEISELRKKIKKLEAATGTNEPIIATFSTATGAGNPVTKKIAYYFSSVNWATSMAYDGGTYIIRVERAADVEWQSVAHFAFIYDPVSGEATGATCGLNFLNADGNIIDPNFVPGLVPEFYSENTVDVSIQYFNIETGQIRLTIHATTTAESYNNVYTGKPMTLDLKFSGKLETIAGGGE